MWAIPMMAKQRKSSSNRIIWYLLGAVQQRHIVDRDGNMKRSTLLLLCCLWLISGAVFSQQSLITGTVRGHIKDTSTTHLPIQGVRVVLVADDGSKTVAETDNNGAFKMIGLAPGHYLLNCYKDRYWDLVDKPVMVVAGGNHEVLLRTAEQAKTGAVRGNVVDPLTEELPVAGARVVLVAANGLETEGETAGNGEFMIVGLAPGRYLVSCYKEGYGDRVGRPVTVLAGATHYVPIKMLVKEPPWLLLICLGVAAVLIVGIAIVVGLRDRPSD